MRFFNLLAHGGRCIGADGRDGFFLRNADFHSDRDGGKGVAHVVFAGSGDVHFYAFTVVHTDKPCSLRIDLQLYGAPVAVFTETEAHDLLFRGAFQCGKQVVIAVYEHLAAVWQVIRDAELLFHDVLACFHELDMRHADVRHDGDVRLCDFCDARHLTGHADAHFDNGGFVLRRDAQNGHGQADLAVRVTGGFHRFETGGNS